MIYILISSVVLFSFFLFVVLAVFWSKLFKEINLDNSKIRELETKQRVLGEIINLILSENTDLDLLMQKIFEVSHNNLDWRAYGLFELDERTQTLILRASYGLTNLYVETLRDYVKVKVGDASVGRAVATRSPAVINNVFDDPRFTSVLPFATEGGYKGLMAIPLIGKKGRVYGSFTVYSKEMNQIVSEDVSFMSLVGSLLTMAIEKSIRQKKLNENPDEILLTFKESW